MWILLLHAITCSGSTHMDTRLSSSADESSTPAADSSTAAKVAVDRRKIGPVLPPVKSQEELNAEAQQRQSAFTTQEAAKESMGETIPPVVRSVLELAHMLMIGHSGRLKACPGYQGGLFYKGKPYCLSCGFRDGTKEMTMECKDNHMRLKDPMVYGQLSVPITAMFLCQLHEEGVFDLEKPIVEYVPDLGDHFDRLTPLRMLSFQTVVDDNKILKDCGACLWKPLLSFNPCDATQTHVYQPINRFFSAGTHQALDGPTQRNNLIQYLRTSGSRMEKPRLKWLQKGRFSHFTMALLVAAAETQLKGVSFEESIRKKIFEPAQAHAAGYGAPKVYRDPNDMFYKPIGQALQHQGFRLPVPIGSQKNCAPALFNGSMNLFAPVEDYAKLLLLAVDTTAKARPVMMPESETASYGHYAFGSWYEPSRREYNLKRKPLHGIDFLPTSSSYRFSESHDVGVFALSSCGTRNGRLFANLFSRVIQHLYIEHISNKGIDPDKSSDDPSAPKTDTEKKFSKLTKDKEYKNVFKRHNAHTRF